MAKGARHGIINPPGHPITITSGPAHIVPAKVAGSNAGLRYKNVGVQSLTKRGSTMAKGTTRMNPARPTGTR